jgi:tetratricopeptide (TPR) repeat protein
MVKRFFINFRAFLTFPMAAGLLICLYGGQMIYAQADSSRTSPTPKPKASPAAKEVAHPKEPLNLDQIFKALRSDKATPAERNQILIRGVRERGISFVLTPEVEDELADQGAGKALIETIRKETQKIRSSSIYYRNLADDLSYKGNYAEAIANYTKSLELDPTDRSAHNNRGRAYEQLKRYDEAFADFTKVIEIDPTDRNGYHNRGVIYYRRSKYQKAVEDYTKAIELDPNFREAYTNRANAYQMMGMRDLAEADRRKAREIEQSRPF